MPVDETADAPPSPWRWDVLDPVRRPSVWVLAGLTVLIAVLATLAAAPDPGGDNPLSLLQYTGPAIPTAVSVLLLARRADFFTQGIVRVFGLGTVFGVLGAVTVFATTWVPPVARTIEAASAGRRHLALEGAHPFFEPLLGGIGSGILGGLAALVLTLPVVAHTRPQLFASLNMNDLDARLADRVRRANIALAWLIVLVFAVPALMVVGSGEAVARDIPAAFTNLPLLFRLPQVFWGDALWVLGLLLIPVMVWLTWYVVRNQRVDRGRRERAGVPVGREFGAGDDDA